MIKIALILGFQGGLNIPLSPLLGSARYTSGALFYAIFGLYARFPGVWYPLPYHASFMLKRAET